MIQALEWQRQGVGVLGHSKTLKGGTKGGRNGLKEGRRERKGECRRTKKEKWKRIIWTGEMVYG